MLNDRSPLLFKQTQQASKQMIANDVSLNIIPLDIYQTWWNIVHLMNVFPKALENQAQTIVLVVLVL